MTDGSAGAGAAAQARVPQGLVSRDSNTGAGGQYFDPPSGGSAGTVCKGSALPPLVKLPLPLPLAAGRGRGPRAAGGTGTGTATGSLLRIVCYVLCIHVLCVVLPESAGATSHC
jgi:hypothetical protein